MARATKNPPKRVAKRGVVLGEGPIPKVPPRPAPKPPKDKGDQTPAKEDKS